MRQKFKYYLRDTYSSEELRGFMEQQGVTLSESAWENMGRPFYEVALDCEVDNKGNITILGVG